ncbi:MAG TPA: hypothetical protein VKA06_01000, partial [Spirochaetia bacterium]|nr:hypothetical protein [Spirochaetia bacterium]
GSALRLAETPPDLVVGTYIEDRATAALFSPLDRLLRRELDRESFYANLLATGVSGGRQHLLPVSFNLPLIYFRSEVPAVETSIIMSDSEVRAAGESFNAQQDDQWTRLAYSPVWNPSFLYQYLRLEGFIARQSEAGTPEWPFEALVSGVTSAREWLESHGGAEADRAFATKYLYDPQLQMVRSGRVAFGYSASNEYLSLSDARRDGLRFRWFGEDRTVHALERIVYAGIPNGAGSQAGAEEFLVNLFSLDEQVALVEGSLRKRVDVFGVVGGFSSLWRMNEAHLGEYYPELRDAIPPARWIAFPPASPRHWGEIVDEVVEPWLVREVTRTPQSRDLEASVRAWLLQQED